MLSINELLSYLDNLLTPNLFRDYCPNGLQVAGRIEIRKIISGVSANQALLDAAVQAQSDLILVHHGYFWRDENPCITGLKQTRLSTLIKNEINLIAYHLPLDAHDTLGNNIQLAKLLGITPINELKVNSGPGLVRIGQLDGMSGASFASHIEKKLNRQPFYIPGRKEKINSIVWCTGAAQDFIELAIEFGADAYLTGEVSERTVSIAKESGIHFYAAGHHATERYGVAALGEHLAQQFGLAHEFIDIDNPI